MKCFSMRDLIHGLKIHSVLFLTNFLVVEATFSPFVHSFGYFPTILGVYLWFSTVELSLVKIRSAWKSSGERRGGFPFGIEFFSLSWAVFMQGEGSSS